MKFVKSIGLEIEGGWFTRRDKPSGGHWHHDGSVRHINTTQNGRGLEFVGEVATIRPLTTMAEVTRWIETFWPDRKNETCGFHIHVALEPKNYYYLMEENFYKEFLKRMYDLGKELKLSKHFFDRLEGKNSYCGRVFNAFKQAEAKDKNNLRYAHLNYCYSLHGTLENRLPPAILKIGQAVKFVEAYIQLIEDYLEKHPKPEKTSYSWCQSFEIEDPIEVNA